VLLGWLNGSDILTRGFPGLIAMKANTAFCFVLLGLSAFLHHSKLKPAGIISKFLALIVVLVGASTLVQIIFKVDFGIDQLLFADVIDPTGTASPGRMAPLSALCFTILATLMLLRTRIKFRIRQIPILAVFAVTMSGLVSYPFSVLYGTGLSTITGMALHTSLLFVLISLALLIEEGDQGWLAVLLSRTTLGQSTRRLLAAVLLAPFLLGGLVFAGESAGLYDAGIARLAYSVGVMLLLTLIVIYNSQRLYEREFAHQALQTDFQEVQRQLLAFVEFSPAAIFIKDKNGKYLQANSVYAKIVGVDRANIVGHYAQAFLPKDLVPLLQKTDREVLETKQVVISEVPFEKDGQKRIYLSNKFPLLNTSGEVHSIGVIWTDITDQKTLTESLNQKNIELERSNQELEQFAYVASHDLQEPLRMVSSYMQLLENRYKDKLDSDATEFIGYAVDGAQRMQSLIQDLLSFSRVGTRGKVPEPMESGLALEEAMRNLKVRIEETAAKISVPEMPRVMADKNQLVQVFQNIIANAMKFKGEDAPQITIQAKEKAGFAEFSIKDNGIGFDQKHADRIFVLFQRLNTREHYQGTGIGLAVCKKIVERHGGSIGVQSQIGKGTTFHFTFPLAKDASSQVMADPAVLQEAETSTIEERAERLI
jgi:PAS domain S-box-containing protein